jgi:hypothetical protein
MSSAHTCAVLAEARYDAWTRFVEGAPGGSIYASPTYLGVLCAATGGTFRILAVEKGAEIVGGVALYEERGASGVRVMPRLLLYYNGPVLTALESRYPYRQTSERLKVLAAMEAWLAGAGYGRLSLKFSPGVTEVRTFTSGGWSVRPTWSYVVSLSDLDETWGRIEQNLRRLVKRAEKEGVTVTEDDDFDSFHRLHLATMERKDRGTYLPYDRVETWFRRLHEQGLATLFHARLPDGRSVATTLLLLGNFPVAHTVSAAADAEHQALGTNPLLRWASFRSLHERGFRGVDLTDAALNAVTRFKGQLGGELVMSLEADAPRTLRYRAAREGQTLYRRLRSGAAGVVRRVFRRATREGA